MSTNDEYLDISYISPEKVVYYEKYVASEKELKLKEIYRKIGILSLENGKYHKYKSFNKFTKKSYPIPSEQDGWLSHVDIAKHKFDPYRYENQQFDVYMQKYDESHIKWIKNNVCDPSAKLFYPDTESLIDKYKNFKMYKTLDNYSIGFIVLIGKENGNEVVYVYGRTKDVIPVEYSIDDIAIFNVLIKKYFPLQIFIGKSYKNEMTTFSGGYGDEWDGNSILLKIDKKKKKKQI